MMTRLELSADSNLFVFGTFGIVFVVMLGTWILLIYRLPRFKAEVREAESMLRQFESSERVSRLRRNLSRRQQVIVLLPIVLCIFIFAFVTEGFTELRYNAHGVELNYRLRPQPITLAWTDVRRVVLVKGKRHHPGFFHGPFFWHIEIVDKDGNAYKSVPQEKEDYDRLHDAWKKLRHAHVGHEKQTP